MWSNQGRYGYGTIIARVASGPSLFNDQEYVMSLFNQYIERYRREEEEYSLEEFLAYCQKDHMAYASSAERMLAAIGEAEMVDTRQDPRLSRLFSNKVIKVYPAFKDFYG